MMVLIITEFDRRLEGEVNIEIAAKVGGKR